MDPVKKLHPSAARLYKVAADNGDNATAQVARRINVSVQNVQNWETRGVSREGALQAQLAYRCDANWILGLGGQAWISGTDSQALAPIASSATRPDYVRFPLLEGFAGMGRGDYVGDYPEIVDWVEVTKEWAKQKLHGVPHSAVRVITGRGQSMRGTYNDGDLIFIDSRVKQFDSDAAYCYRWEGKVHIKRLQQIGKGKVRIISANPEWPAIEVKLADLEIGGMALAAWTLVEF